MSSNRRPQSSRARRPSARSSHGRRSLKSSVPSFSIPARIEQLTCQRNGDSAIVHLKRGGGGEIAGEPTARTACSFTPRSLIFPPACPIILTSGTTSKTGISTGCVARRCVYWEFTPTRRAMMRLSPTPRGLARLLLLSGLRRGGRVLLMIAERFCLSSGAEGQNSSGTAQEANPESCGWRF